MNLKLWAVASVALSISAAAGCIAAPDPVTSGGLGGTDNPSGSGEASSGETSSGSLSGGGGSSGTGVTGAARMFYINTVHPLLVSANDMAASCTACHVKGESGAPMFMDTAADVSYTKMDTYSGLIVRPGDSQLLLHGKHTGPALTQVQKDNVTQWLTMEAEERGMGGGASSSSGGMPPVPTVAEAIAQVGKCMQETDWTGNKLELLASQQTANAGNCGGCHSDGEGGLTLNILDPTGTFLAQTVTPGVKRWFKAEYVNGQFTGKLLPNPRVYLKGDTLPPCDPKAEICHPKYLLSPTIKKNIDNFINLTLTRMNTNACLP